jgi:hypothetical protein
VSLRDPRPACAARASQGSAALTPFLDATAVVVAAKQESAG